MHILHAVQFKITHVAKVLNTAAIQAQEKLNLRWAEREMVATQVVAEDLKETAKTADVATGKAAIHF